MGAGDGLRIFMIVIGVAILAVTITSLARKHMTETFCIAWGVVAVGAICAGLVLRPTEWNHYVSWQGLMLILFGGVFVLAGAFFCSLRISRLNREVKELAIKVALLDHENAVIMGELTGDASSDRSGNEEKTPVCN